MYAIRSLVLDNRGGNGDGVCYYIMIMMMMIVAVEVLQMIAMTVMLVRGFIDENGSTL